MGLCILIVDDSRVARMSLRRQLTEIAPDCSIVEAGSYDDALVQIEAHVPELALIDFNMPGHDGLELARVLKERLPDLRMALVTANIQDAVSRRAIEMGMAFVAKPASLAQLQAFVAGGQG
ncbi:response regulator transcription factor [Novispirillum itersonii]|uniref:CheY-like chemotaxis protein n=1 Tax=Novispirillum itersonii TaxID=189 RepID=A0A7X0DLB4_NOVIT|nr:response regulator transcription factor [Novispirillum itersonii]MBB6209853.1 CheY-like chemotaxis protein [Novispirillum itersonii]